MSEEIVKEVLPAAGKLVGDSASIGVTVLSFIEYLPAVSALLAIFWTVIRIYETKTVQRWLGNKTD